MGTPEIIWSCIALVISIASFVVAAYFYKWVKQLPVANARLEEVGKLIRDGAFTFLKREYRILGLFAAVVMVLIILFFPEPIWHGNPGKNITMAIVYLFGTALSALAGYVGISIATLSNVRAATAAQESIQKSFMAGFRGGAVMGMAVVGTSLAGAALVYLVTQDPEIVMAFSFGASSLALFAKAGGGIFTKTADIAADLTGKVELGIPEDDPRNPAVIADNVGDNVGDVAGMGADLYESYVGSIVSTCALAVAAGYGASGVSVPMLLAALGVLCSIVGSFFVKTKEGASQKNLLTALRTGTYIASALIAVCAWFAVHWLLPAEHATGVFIAVISGLVAGVAIGAITEYYTSDTYKPTQRLSASSETGSATVIISGLSLGMLSTVAPVVIVGVSVLLSYFCAGGVSDFNMGLYGVGVSAVGMLSTLGITLATDAYGPIADNAGGIAEMTHMPAEVRQRTDALDSLGNTTAATGKGFAIGSAALTALALIASYIDKVHQIKPDMVLDLTITNPTTLIGLFIGGMLPFLFAALTMDAVGKAAQSIVVEVRRQFSTITGLMEGKAEPDYARCVDMCTRSAQKLMLAPALIAVIVPVVVGLILGVNGVAGLLAGTTVTGFVLAVMMANSGGAWDNAKKYIESGQHGGKGSDCHKAAVVGDTVGDPFKDTSGPAINILIKLTSMVSIVFAGLIVAVHLL